MLAHPLKAKFFQQRRDARMLFPVPRGSEISLNACGTLRALREAPSSDPIARFQDQNRPTCFGKAYSTQQPGNAGAYDRNVCVRFTRTLPTRISPICKTNLRVTHPLRLIA